MLFAGILSGFIDSVLIEVKPDMDFNRPSMEILNSSVNGSEMLYLKKKAGLLEYKSEEVTSGKVGPGSKARDRAKGNNCRAGKGGSVLTERFSRNS